VSFRFNPTGARAFGEYTSANVGAPFAIVLDNQVISAPTIQSAIPGGSGIITGRFTIEESTDLAVLLRAGALPAELTFLEERTIGPELGQDSIDAGRVAAVIAIVVVIVYMIASYGIFGVFASLSLATAIILIVGLLSLLGATLTLPGLAGIVLIIGMAVDANVLVFERIREELRHARSPSAAISKGFQMANSAIVDANVTTLITAGVLFYIGSGTVRGFAVTLAIGILTSVFAALLVTRVLIALWLNRARPRTVVV
jgi:preprotein translocase subunit SecD